MTDQTKPTIKYAEPGYFVFSQRRVYSFGPSCCAEIGMLRDGETLQEFLEREIGDRR